MTEWRDISTAPTRADAIDILSASGKRYTDCWWGKPTYKDGTTWVYQSGYDCDGPVDDPVPNPMYWMPLPGLPEVE